MKFSLKRKLVTHSHSPVEKEMVAAYFTKNGHEYKAFEMHAICLDAKIVKTLDKTGDVTVCFVMEAK